MYDFKWLDCRVINPEHNFVGQDIKISNIVFIAKRKSSYVVQKINNPSKSVGIVSGNYHYLLDLAQLLFRSAIVPVLGAWVHRLIIYELHVHVHQPRCSAVHRRQDVRRWGGLEKRGKGQLCVWISHKESQAEEVKKCRQWLWSRTTRVYNSYVTGKNILIHISRLYFAWQ